MRLMRLMLLMLLMLLLPMIWPVDTRSYVYVTSVFMCIALAGVLMCARLDHFGFTATHEEGSRRIHREGKHSACMLRLVDLKRR